jgi:hypothetical protein
VIAIAAAVLLAGVSCVEVEGGAVELSWRLRDVRGGDSDCALARVGTIRVCWVPVTGDAGADQMTECTIVRTDAGFSELFREFDCTEKRGVTRFEVPAGPNALFVRPVCADGQAPTGDFQVPPPIVRNVETGGVVTLNQLLIVVSADDCVGEACTCPPP